MKLTCCSPKMMDVIVRESVQIANVLVVTLERAARRGVAVVLIIA